MAVPYTFIHGEKRRLTTMYFQIKMKGEFFFCFFTLLSETSMKYIYFLLTQFGFKWQKVPTVFHNPWPLAARFKMIVVLWFQVNWMNNF